VLFASLVPAQASGLQTDFQACLERVDRLEQDDHPIILPEICPGISSVLPT